MTNTVWIAQLERFDYQLVAIGRTEEEARNAILKAYQKAFQERNGTDPAKTVATEYGTSRTFYEIAKEEIFVEETEYGKVLWQ